MDDLEYGGKSASGKRLVRVTCPACGQERLIGAFNWSRRRSDFCRSCCGQARRAPDELRRERQRAAAKKYRESDKARAYRESHREHLKAVSAIWTKANEDRLRAVRRAKYQAQRSDPERHAAALAAARARYLARKERCCPKHQAWLARCNARKRTNPKAILRTRMHSTIHRVLKRYGGAKAGRKTADILGYSMETLERHLMKTLPAGAEWSDYIAGRLHIDHIVPVSAFNFSSEVDYDFRRCFALKNLRLTWATDNLRKSAKLLQPFQPSLL